jgi:hypothetical protein
VALLAQQVGRALPAPDVRFVSCTSRPLHSSLEFLSVAPLFAEQPGLLGFGFLLVVAVISLLLRRAVQRGPGAARYPRLYWRNLIFVSLQASSRGVWSGAFLSGNYLRRISITSADGADSVALLVAAFVFHASSSARVRRIS